MTKFEWESIVNLGGMKLPYPPFLKSIPSELKVPSHDILDPQARNDSARIRDGDATVLPGMAPTNSRTMKDVEEFVRARHEEQGINMYNAPNVGLRDDWFTDAVFGQQTLTGPNPGTITLATSWIGQFTVAAREQRIQAAIELLEGQPETFYVVDFSRLAGFVDRKSTQQYGAASVTLFRLEPTSNALESEGRMHPFAILLDYYQAGSEQNVFIFNRRLTSLASSNIPEADDWPWRYAKTVTQVVNWLDHEVRTHLVEAHLVIEASLVAAHIVFENKQDHLVFELLKAHRDVTFSVNDQARRVLVPLIIAPASGFPTEKVFEFLNISYAKFGWKNSYVPKNLSDRGFPIGELEKKKYRNCASAKGVAEMWGIVHKFVSTVLAAQYPQGDTQVAEDPYIREFCTEMRGEKKGRLTTFPERIETLSDLVDVVTNIIHIATTQHTVINYLQQYYMTFVPNFPGALYKPIPTSLGTLMQVDERYLMDSLPIGRAHRFQWLMMGQVPYLLSFSPPQDKTLLRYALDESSSPQTNTVRDVIREAAGTLTQDLVKFTATVRRYSEAMEDQKKPYLVLDPLTTTSSIIL